MSVKEDCCADIVMQKKLLLQNLWWQMFGNFDHIHPEYEVLDWNLKSMFLDIAYTPDFFKLNIEIDGYQSHIKEMDRESHSKSLQFDNYLTGMGWKILRFSYDVVRQRPEFCRMMLQLTLSNSIITHPAKTPIPLIEREILQLTWFLVRDVRPIDLINRYHINFRTARARLHSLAEKGLLKPIASRNGIRSYKLTDNSLSYLL